jgi:hypothetical protein
MQRGMHKKKHLQLSYEKGSGSAARPCDTERYAQKNTYAAELQIVGDPPIFRIKC